MRSMLRMVFSSMLTLATCDLALAQSPDAASVDKRSVCLPKYQLLAERNSEVPMQAAVCSGARTTHIFPTREVFGETYDFHEKLENHMAELVVHVPFRLIQVGLATAVDKEYSSTSGYSNNSKRDQTARSDSAYMGIQWTPNLNTTVAYHKEYYDDSAYDRERFLPSLSYRPFGSFLNFNASILVENSRLRTKFAAFADITDVHNLGLIIQPLFDLEDTTRKELIHSFKGDGYILQTRFILQEYKGHSDYRSLESSDGFMLGQDLSFEISENSIVGTAVSYANYKKFSNIDTIYPDDFASPSIDYPATEKGYAWGLSLNYSYLL